MLYRNFSNVTSECLISHLSKFSHTSCVAIIKCMFYSCRVAASLLQAPPVLFIYAVVYYLLHCTQLVIWAYVKCAQTNTYAKTAYLTLNKLLHLYTVLCLLAMFSVSLYKDTVCVQCTWCTLSIFCDMSFFYSPWMVFISIPTIGNHLFPFSVQIEWGFPLKMEVTV